MALESTPAHGNLAAAEFVGTLCTEAGLHVELQRESLEGIDQCNVIARPAEGMPDKEILFQTHLDTVEGGHFSHWTKTQSNPFNASIYNDVLYGLGAADAKLDFLCKIEAAREMAGKKMKTPFVLVGTFGSQTGMTGAIKLIRRKKINATHAVIGEPTEMRLVNAAKGFANLEISIPFSQEEYDYRRSHDLQESASSQSRIFSAKAGDNAIMKMFEYIAHLPEGIAVMDLNGGINFHSVPSQSVLEIDTVAGFKDPILPKISRLYTSLREVEASMMEFREEGFDPPHPTANMGMIRTFDTEVRILGTVRLPPSVDDSAYQGWMNKLENAVKSVGATFRVKDYRKGFNTRESDFVRGAQAVLSGLGLNSTLAKAARASEASVFSRHGIECLMFGPGQSVGNSQSPNESVKIGDLNTASAFYKQLMERFCL